MNSPNANGQATPAQKGEADARLRAIVESGIVGVVQWNATGQIVEANDAFLALLGADRADLRARRLNWRKLTPEQWRADDDLALEALRRSGRSLRLDKEYIRLDGTHVFVRLRSVRIAEDPETFLSLVVDLTHEKQAERERDALLERERRARLDAEAAVHARDTILSIVSHDLRNYLHSISLAAELCTSTEGRDTAGIIRRAVARSNRLIKDLLDVNQLATGNLSITPEVLPVETIVHEACSLFQHQAQQKAQTLQWQVDAPPLVRVDHHRMVQVLSNLISNALKFTPEGGRVEVQAKAHEGGSLLSVADTGPGIDEEDLQRIFDRFWQARRVRRGGIGLGLPITKGLVEAHGGRIWAESRAGIGCTFYVWLPAAVGPAAEQPSPQRTIDSSQS